MCWQQGCLLSDPRAATLTLCSVSHFTPHVAALGCVLWHCHPMAPWGPFDGSRRAEPSKSHHYGSLKPIQLLLQGTTIVFITQKEMYMFDNCAFNSASLFESPVCSVPQLLQVEQGLLALPASLPRGGTARGGTSLPSLCPSMQHGTEHMQEVKKLPTNEQGQQLLVLQMWWQRSLGVSWEILMCWDVNGWSEALLNFALQGLGF